MARPTKKDKNYTKYKFCFSPTMGQKRFTIDKETQRTYSRKKAKSWKHSEAILLNLAPCVGGGGLPIMC